MYTDAKCKINGVEVREVTLNFVDKVIDNAGSSIIYASCQYDEKTKRLAATHGKCTAPVAVLSKHTLDLIRELKTSIEEDLLNRHFNINPDERNQTDEARLTIGEDEEVSQI
jgi:hypothetical protein